MLGFRYYARYLLPYPHRRAPLPHGLIGAVGRIDGRLALDLSLEFSSNEPA